MKNIHLPQLIIHFNNPIRQDEISKFRGAIIHTLTSSNILFHNHKDEGLRYSYPLIQYKRIKGKATIVCIGEGTKAVGEFFSGREKNVKLGDKEIELELESVKAKKMLIQVWESNFTYTCRKWLPLNQENYEKFQSIESLKEKCAFLEKILIGNVLSFAKGLDIRFEKEVKVDILNFEEKDTMKYKNISFATFDLTFKSNVSIPNYIGLGKGVSHGFGTVAQVKNEK